MTETIREVKAQSAKEVYDLICNAYANIVGLHIKRSERVGYYTAIIKQRDPKETFGTYSSTTYLSRKNHGTFMNVGGFTL